MVSVQLSRNRQHGIAHRFRVDARPVHTPQQAIIGIDLRPVLALLRFLLIRSAAEDHAMQRFSDPCASSRNQTASQSSSSGMRWLGTHAAEVARRIDDSGAEVILPNAIHDGSPREHVVWIGDPVGQSGTALAFVSQDRRA